MLNTKRTIGIDNKANTNPHKQVTMAAEVLNKHSALILATIRSNINDKSEANDILHDFFLSLVYNPIPAHIQNIRAYLQKAVKNDVLDAAARTKGYRARIQRYAQCHNNMTTYQDPQSIAIQTEQTQKMFELVEKQLPRREAQAVIERCYHDRDTEQTAERMCVNKRSVSRYLCTGLRRVRRLMYENPAGIYARD
jgi:RNA polymerase sigma factor (sigma-70 family)